MFRYAAVFSGGASLEAFERVCGALSVDSALDLLEALSDKSLLRVIETDEELRVEMLETIHGFARELLEAEGEEVV